MAHDEAPRKTRRVSLSVTPQVVGYLEDLAAQGIVGSTASEVAKVFVQRGIEQAIKDGFLEIRGMRGGRRETGRIETP